MPGRSLIFEGATLFLTGGYPEMLKLDLLAIKKSCGVESAYFFLKLALERRAHRYSPLI